MRWENHTVSRIRSWSPDMGFRKGTWMRTSLDVWLAPWRDFDMSWWDSLGQRVCCWPLLTCVLAWWDEKISPFLAFAVGVQIWVPEGYLNEDLLRCLTSAMKGLWHILMRQIGSKDVLLAVAHLRACMMRWENHTVSRIRSWSPDMGPRKGTWMRTSLDVWLAPWRDFDMSWWDSLGQRGCCWPLLTCVLAWWDERITRFLAFAVGVQIWVPEGYLNEDLLRCLTSTMKGLWHVLMRLFGSKGVLLAVAHLRACMMRWENHTVSRIRSWSPDMGPRRVPEWGPP